MSKTPQSRKDTPKPRAAKGGPARKPTKTARRTATSRKAVAKPGRRTDRRRGGAKAAVKKGSKLAILIELLGRSAGASVPEMAVRTGWQHHSVRGFLSGTVKKKLGHDLASETVEGRGRIYRIAKRP